MNLKAYLSTLTTEEKDEFACRAETSTAYLSQIASGHRKAGIKSIENIVQATGNLVTRHELRPDIFGDQDAA